MYTKDKSNRITLRLNDEQFEYLKRSADFLSFSPSEFLRAVINATMAMEKCGAIKSLDKFASEEEARRENETSSQHDQL